MEWSSVTIWLNLLHATMARTVALHMCGEGNPVHSHSQSESYQLQGRANKHSLSWYTLSSSHNLITNKPTAKPPTPPMQYNRTCSLTWSFIIYTHQSRLHVCWLWRGFCEMKLPDKRGFALMDLCLFSDLWSGFRFPACALTRKNPCLDSNIKLTLKQR